MGTADTWDISWGEDTLGLPLCETEPVVSEVCIVTVYGLCICECVQF